MNHRTFISDLFPNSRQICISPENFRKREGKPIIVNSLMRSGTHVLIDLILNNFHVYKKYPLYIDLDAWIRNGNQVSELLSCGNYIIKTHYPQFRGEIRSSKYLDSEISKLAVESYIIQPERDIRDTYSSLKNFCEHPGGFEALLREKNSFDTFWGNFNSLKIDQKNLIDRSKTLSLVDSIAAFIEAKPSGKIVPPPKKNEINKVLWVKLLTRIFGCYSSVVNTTVVFSPKSR